MNEQDKSRRGKTSGMKSRNVKLSRKLGGGFAVLLLLAAAIGVVGYTGVHGMEEDVERIAARNALYGTSHHIKTLMLQHRRYEKDIFLNIGNRTKQVDKYLPRIEAKSKEIREAIAQFNQGVQADAHLASDVKEKARQLPGLYEQYYKGMRTVTGRAMEEAQITPQAANKAMEPHKEAIHDLEGNIDEIADAVSDAFGGQVDDTLASAARSSTRITVVGLVAITGGLLLCIFIVRNVTRPIRRIIVDLNESVGQVNDAASQVSCASQQLAEGASEQASSLEETSSALEQMAAMTRQNADGARKANTLSGQARDAAEGGDKTMEKLNKAMAGINKSSEEISKIIKVIEEIAFQTNLLALNAAVEAARAGEHGKGFAVVAEEVRSLAQRSAKAAGETTELIEESVLRAKEGTDVAAEVGQALGAIAADITKLTDLVDGIAQASQQQAQGADQVNTAVSQMDKVTQQNAAGAEQSASAAEELSAQSQTVKGIVQQLSVLVDGEGAGTTAHTADAVELRKG